MPLWSKKFNISEDLADLSGKVIIVTGANTGIGYNTAKHLARKGAKVYVGSRSEERGRRAIEQLRVEGIGAGEVILLPCSFDTPAQAKAAAESFLQLENRLDILVNNAGCTWDQTDKLAQDGITEMMMINHIGTFQFTLPLLPLLIKTSEEEGSDVRIVNLASDAHRRGVAGNADLSFANMDLFKNSWPNEQIPYFARYFISKLANVLFTHNLQRRLESTSIICMSLHPGLVNTSIISKTTWPRLMTVVMWLFSTPADEGAYTSCFAAGSPLVRASPETYKSAYLEPVGKIGKASSNSLRIDLQDELWATTEKYLEGLVEPRKDVK